MFSIRGIASNEHGKLIGVTQVLPLNRARRIAIGASLILLQWLITRSIDAPHANIAVVLLLNVLALATVGLFSGPMISVLCSVVAVATTNWFLIPPFGTFRVANADNVVALVVFPLIAGGIAVLIQISARLRTTAQTAEQQNYMLSTVVDPDETLMSTLKKISHILNVDSLDLFTPTGHSVLNAEAVLARDASDHAFQAMTTDGYTLVGYGSPIIGYEQTFVRSLADAAVRAYESETTEIEIRRRKELESINDVRSALMASIGHDLRTPLASLRLAIDALQDTQNAAADAQLLASSIESSARRIDETLTNLLDMSRLEAGNLVLHYEDIYIDQLLTKVCQEVNDPRVLQSTKTGTVLINTDPVLLERIVANLLSNALRHDESGSPVELTALLDDQAVVISVIDHGPGFSPQILKSSTEGTRLGLRIVESFAQALNVEVTIAGLPDVSGTIASVRIGRAS